MPIVSVRYKKGALTDPQIEALAPKIQEVLAHRLTCDEFTCPPDDVDIEFVERRGTYNGRFHILIQVLGQDFPSRVANLNVRLDQIKADLEPVFPAGWKCCIGCFLPVHNGRHFDGSGSPLS